MKPINREGASSQSSLRLNCLQPLTDDFISSICQVLGLLVQPRRMLLITQQPRMTFSHLCNFGLVWSLQPFSCQGVIVIYAVRHLLLQHVCRIMRLYCTEDSVFETQFFFKKIPVFATFLAA